MNLTRSLTDRWEPFLDDFYGIVLEGASSGARTKTYISCPRLIIGDCELEFYPDFQCREDPAHNKLLSAKRAGAEFGSCDLNIILDFTNYFLELLLKGCSVHQGEADESGNPFHAAGDDHQATFEDQRSKCHF